MTAHPTPKQLQNESPESQFRAELPGIARELRDARRADDRPRLRRLAHRLVGSAGLLALPAISAPAAVLYSILNRGNHAASIKRDLGLVESVDELILACERAAGTAAPRS